MRATDLVPLMDNRVNANGHEYPIATLEKIAQACRDGRATLRGSMAEECEISGYLGISKDARIDIDADGLAVLSVSFDLFTDQEKKAVGKVPTPCGTLAHFDREKAAAGYTRVNPEEYEISYIYAGDNSAFACARAIPEPK